MAHRGRYKPEHPEKYRGDVTPCDNCGKPKPKPDAKGCSRSCSVVLSRKRLKSDSEAHGAFVQKVKANMKGIWEEREENGLAEVIRKSIGVTRRRNNSLLTAEERKKYGHSVSEKSLAALCDYDYVAVHGHGNRKGTKQSAETREKISIGGCLAYAEGRRTLAMAHKGWYRVENTEKYKGDATKVCYRSSWELKLFKRLDRDPNVAEWSSEEIIIPYNDRSTGRLRRYFPDVYMKRRDGKVFLIEVKPLKETSPPARKGKNEKRFLSECLTYAKNVSKWSAAQRYCTERGWEFILITERELGIK